MLQVHADLHPSEDQWEEYALGRVRGLALDSLDDHLLLCDQCQDKLAQLDAFINGLKLQQGHSVWRPKLTPEAGRSWSRPAWLFRSAAIAGVAAAGIAALLLARNIAPAAPQKLVLESYRGSPDATPQARPGAPLDLSADLTDLPPGADPYIEVAAADGKIVKSKTLSPNGRAVIPKGLPEGVYWIRLYAPETRLVREFGLRVTSRYEPNPR
jgi:hypothetical protein